MKEDKTSLKILEILKWKGPASQEELASQLELSTMAVSKHLTNYLDLGYVKFEERRQERGRPIKYWSPTREADRFFPNAHSKLALSLINSTEIALGEEALGKILATHTTKKVEQYRQELVHLPSLEQKVKRLAEIRNAEGYLAEFSVMANGEFQLIENHCPICDVANHCAQLCASELKVMMQVLGHDVDIDRTEHIQSEDRRCVYHIKAK